MEVHLDSGIRLLYVVGVQVCVRILVQVEIRISVKFGVGLG